VPHLALSWPSAAILAGGAAVAAVILARIRNRRLAAAGRFAGEAALLLALYALWQYAGSFSVLPASGGLPRAQWLWDSERMLHLPDEAGVQRLFLPYPPLIRAFNLYYAVLHFPVLIGCLVWLFGWHREQYRRIRTTVVLFTGASLLVQLIPVAPPRMLPGAGLVDTAARYGESVYAWSGGLDADQFSAMPSVHVGWALIVAMAVITVSRSRWRWAAAAYPALTTLVVAVTANHFWMDGIAAAGLLIAALLAQRAARSVRGRFVLRSRLADPARLLPRPARTAR
jgi:hypothetical protein